MQILVEPSVYVLRDIYIAEKFQILYIVYIIDVYIYWIGIWWKLKYDYPSFNIFIWKTNYHILNKLCFMQVHKIAGLICHRSCCGNVGGCAFCGAYHRMSIYHMSIYLFSCLFLGKSFTYISLIVEMLIIAEAQYNIYIGTRCLHKVRPTANDMDWQP